MGDRRWETAIWLNPTSERSSDLNSRVQRCIVSPVSFATVNLGRRRRRSTKRRSRKGKGRYSLFYKSRVAVGSKKEKESTANDEGYGALSKYVSSFLFHPEHPAERAPLCISMHSGGLVARVRVRVHARVAGHRSTRARVVRFTRARRRTIQMRDRAKWSIARVDRDYEIPRGSSICEYSAIFERSGPQDNICLCTYLVSIAILKKMQRNAENGSPYSKRN